jgi:hypothetical protein
MNDRKGTASSEPKRTVLSLDWWTVIVAAAIAAIVLAGVPALPW